MAGECRGNKQIHLKRCTVRTLMNIFVHIFEGGERYQAFNVDMTVELCGKIGVVWDNPPIINHNPINLVFPAVVRSVIEWIAFAVNTCVWLEGLREMLYTLPILETPIAAAMHHAPLHSLK